MTWTRFSARTRHYAINWRARPLMLYVQFVSTGMGMTKFRRSHASVRETVASRIRASRGSAFGHPVRVGQRSTGCLRVAPKTRRLACPYATKCTPSCRGGHLGTCPLPQDAAVHEGISGVEQQSADLRVQARDWRPPTDGYSARCGLAVRI